jgi:hypothetical protein
MMMFAGMRQRPWLHSNYPQSTREEDAVEPYMGSETWHIQEKLPPMEQIYTYRLKNYPVCGHLLMYSFWRAGTIQKSSLKRLWEHTVQA